MVRTRERCYTSRDILVFTYFEDCSAYLESCLNVTARATERETIHDQNRF